MSNPYEHAARLQKAYKLAAYLHQYSITSDEVKLITSEQWKVLAKHAGANPPGSHESIQLIEEALKQLERPRLSREEVMRAFRRCAE